MLRRFLCRLGFHQWRHFTDEIGRVTYGCAGIKMCIACKKVRMTG
jgi:hypothetical protein